MTARTNGLTYQQALDVLARVTYRKPGVELTARVRYDKPWHPLQLTWRMATPDPVTGELVSIVSDYMIDMQNDISEEMLLRITFRFIMECEDHEAREWFRIDGRQIYPTH